MGKKLIKKTKKSSLLPIKKEDGRKNNKHGKPPKEHQWKKGKSGNPGGQTKEKRALKEFTSAALTEAIQIVMTSTEEEALALLNDTNQALSFKVVLRAVVDAAHNGDYAKFYQIAEHILGKIPNKVDVTTLGQQLGMKLEDKQKVKAALKAVEEEI